MQATSSGFGSLNAFAAVLLLGIGIAVALVIGGILFATHRRAAGRLLIVPAVALGAFTGIGAATGPSYQAAVLLTGRVEVTLSAPAGVEIAGFASCEVPDNSDIVRSVQAVSAGYLLGERVSVSVLLSDAGVAEITLLRSQEAAEVGHQLPPYGAVGEARIVTSAGTLNREGGVEFTGLGPLSDGPGWGGDVGQHLDGKIRWSCDQPLTVDASPVLEGTIAFGGAVDASLGLGGGCQADTVLAAFQVPSGKDSVPPAEGDPVAGTLTWTEPGWELALYREELDARAVTVLADRATFTREADAAGSGVLERFEGEFTLPYGTVTVEASWRCEPDQGG